MQTSELEKLSQRIREAEERLRRVEEENEGSSLGGPTPPISPFPPQFPNARPSSSETGGHSSKESFMEEKRGTL
jgi:hypothetical protein